MWNITISTNIKPFLDYCRNPQIKNNQNPWYESSIFEWKISHAKFKAPKKNYLLPYVLCHHQHAQLWSLCVSVSSLVTRSLSLKMFSLLRIRAQAKPTLHTSFSYKTDHWLHNYVCTINSLYHCVKTWTAR